MAKYLFTILVSLIGISMSAGATVIASSAFDSGLDGWSGVPGETTFISHVLNGGNPNGYIQNIDQGPTGGNIIAPLEYLGNWSGLESVGHLSWDYNLFSAGPNNGNIVTLQAYISGPGGSATFDSGITPQPIDGWASVVAPIQQSAWTISAGDWGSLLANITELRLLIEPVFSTAFPGEVSGIDNVSLSTVPEPSTWLLLITGFLGMVPLKMGAALSERRLIIDHAAMGSMLSA